MNTDIREQPIRIYIGHPLEGVDVVFPIEPHVFPDRKVKKNLWNYFQGKEKESDFDFLRLVDQPKDADFLLLPHNYFSLKNILGGGLESYLATFVELSKKYGKKILIFAMADSDEDINIPNSMIFRFSQYGYKKKDNEIMMPFYNAPAYSEGGMAYREEVWKNMSYREKQEKPTVSFCGWAGFPSIYRHLTYAGRVGLADFRAHILGDKHAEVHKSGIYFRRKALKTLGRSKKIKTNFIVRGSYSAQKGRNGKKAIRPEEAEREYVESIIQSDFVLSPKGNGNGSIRFYEALSLGRLPILIDTDCVLPLEDVINYAEFVIRVDYREMQSVVGRTLAFYQALSSEEFYTRQKKARESFEFLRPGAFCSYHLRIMLLNCALEKHIK
jgi:hypothetical protein